MHLNRRLDLDCCENSCELPITNSLLCSPLRRPEAVEVKFGKIDDSIERSVSRNSVHRHIIGNHSAVRRSCLLLHASPTLSPSSFEALDPSGETSYPLRCRYSPCAPPSAPPNPQFPSLPTRGPWSIGAMGCLSGSDTLAVFRR